MKQSKFPPGWNSYCIMRVLEHYEAQSKEAVAEGAFEREDQTVMEIFSDLLPAVRELLAGHRDNLTIISGSSRTA